MSKGSTNHLVSNAKDFLGSITSQFQEVIQDP